METIRITNLTKCYPKGKMALDDVSFTVNGGVFGLLGHNGAGKTTLMKALATILQPSSGQMQVCGFDTRRQGEKVRASIGYLPQELSMYPSLSVFDFVDYIARLKGIHNKDMVHSALKRVEMLDFSRQKIGKLSGGMKRRVGIAQALVGKPQVLIVDEPTAGLDPEERVRFRGVLSSFAREGRTVLLSTHLVEDVYQICGALAVLRKGRLFYTGSPQGLMDQIKGCVKVLQLKGEEELAWIRSRAAVLSVTYGGEKPCVRVADINNAFPQAEAVEESLEDAYIYCMGGKSCEKDFGNLPV